MQTPSFFTDLEKASRLREELERSANVFKAMHASTALPRSLNSVSDLAKSIGAVAGPGKLRWFDSTVFKSLEAESTTLRALEAQAAQWRSLTGNIGSVAPRLTPPASLTDQVNRSALAWRTGVSESLKFIGEIGNLRSSVELSNSLLRPSLLHGKFAEQTLSLIKEASDPKAIKALNASLKLVDAQHVANMELLTTLVPSVDDVGLGSPSWGLNAPFVQREELLSESELENDEDLGLVVALSPAAQRVEQTRLVLQLTTDCNKASRTKGGVEIFTPTTRVLETFANLPWITPRDEKSFGDFVDGLYFIAYEGAGKDKLRFLREYGGPLLKEDCDVIWSVKTLRNKWLRHDPDHGKESDIKKSWSSLEECLRRLGIQGYPRAEADYQLLHGRILTDMADFLGRLLRAI